MDYVTPFHKKGLNTALIKICFLFAGVAIIIFNIKSGQFCYNFYIIKVVYTVEKMFCDFRMKESAGMTRSLGALSWCI